MIAPEKIGKKATTAARPITARSGWSSPAQMLTRGAMATIGVTCRATARGRTARSARGLSPIRRAMAKAQALAITRAQSAIDRVVQAEAARMGALAIKAANTALGAGRR